MNNNETVVDHEVRIRLLESIAQKMDSQFEKMETRFDARFDRLEAKFDSKMDTQFHWVLGTMFTVIITIVTFFGGVILHLAKLI